MLANNNQEIITRMAGQSLKRNKRRKFILIFAILLSSFMLFSVLTVGVTYFKMQHLQELRLNGAEFDAIVYGVTEEQQTLCQNSSAVGVVGIAGIAGWVEETEKDSTPNIGLIWADDSYWNIMMKPAREVTEGSYPQKENEVMVTKDALKECGMEDLNIGDSFVMTYQDSFGNHQNRFYITGIWDGYGEKKAFYVSKTFYNQSGRELESVGSGRCFIDFKSPIMTEKQQNIWIEQMNLKKQQRMFFVGNFESSVSIVAGILGLILVTCFCAYLLIYNIMYLSISSNTRYYGLLQTVGMTGKQIDAFIKKQMFFVGSIGILSGILLGASISFFLIPSIVRFLGIRGGKIDKIQISFHPAIFLLTILLAGFTIYIAGRKPAKMAVSISPIEALGYRVTAKKKILHKTGKGTLIWRMAKEQFLKDKKKSGIVILSLAAGLSIFLCMITLIESQGARTMVSNYMEMDMVIKNDTLKKEKKEQRKRILEDDFLQSILKNPAIKEVHPFLNAQIIVPWEPEFADIWMREFYETWMSIPYEDDREEYKKHPENFGSTIVGIDQKEFEYLNQTLEYPVNLEDFLSGKSCILYAHELDFKNDDLQGKKVYCAEYENSQNKRTFEIAGLTNESYYTGSLIGYPPTIIVSDQAIQEFIKDSYIYKLSINYQQEYDKKAEADLLSLMQNSPYPKDFSYDSKIEEMEAVEKAQGNMLEVGIGIVAILALIGILNYINTVTGNIQNRQVELAILESIGMTEKQIRWMLMQEGSLFAGASFLLTGTIGMGITYTLYQSMNYREIPFEIPWLPMVGMMFFMLLICILIPLRVQSTLSKRGSVIERISGFE